jgi:hypothetical protein
MKKRPKYFFEQTLKFAVSFDSRYSPLSPQAAIGTREINKLCI